MSFSEKVDILGADSKLITIKVDATKVASDKGGGVASIAAMLVPGTISTKVYVDMAAKLKSGLAEQGIQAEVNVVETVPGQAFKSTFLEGLGAGIAATSITYGIYRLVKHFFFAKKGQSK
jgi:hypothetical protein